ncbi:hypothetical protein HDU91_002616 [Kappamyces sp. JEL0680]|nr:hypothetical protein HDU91_002616 [Kappamyces sp. JEL0680]
MAVLTKFFAAVSTESPYVRNSVQDALSAMSAAYSQNHESGFAEAVKDILLDNIDKDTVQARFSAVRYANRIFPFSDPFARYICLLAVADAKLEVQEEGLKGLAFPGPEVISEQESAIPAFGKMVDCLRTFSTRPRPHIVRPPGTVWIGSYSEHTFTYLLLFLHQLLIKAIAPEHTVDKLSTVVDDKLSWPLADLRAKMKSGLAQLLADDTSSVMGFVGFIQEALSSPSASRAKTHLLLLGGTLQSIASFYFLELVALSPSSLSESLYEKRDWLYSFVAAPKIETKAAMTRAMAIILTSSLTEAAKRSEFDAILNKLLVLAESPVSGLECSWQDYDAKMGSVLGLGFLFGRTAYRYQDPLRYIPLDSALLIVKSIEKAIGADQSELVTAGCIALGEVTRYAKLAATLEELVAGSIAKAKTLVNSAKETKVGDAG